MHVVGLLPACLCDLCIFLFYKPSIFKSKRFVSVASKRAKEGEDGSMIAAKHGAASGNTEGGQTQIHRKTPKRHPAIAAASVVASSDAVTLLAAAPTTGPAMPCMDYPSAASRLRRRLEGFMAPPCARRQKKAAGCRLACTSRVSPATRPPMAAVLDSKPTCLRSRTRPGRLVFQSELIGRSCEYSKQYIRRTHAYVVQFRSYSILVPPTNC
jgi:hypothetical protein